MDSVHPRKRGYFEKLSSDVISTSPLNVGSIQEFKRHKEEPHDFRLVQVGQLNDADVGYSIPMSMIKLIGTDSTGTPSTESGHLDTMPRLSCAFCHSFEESESSGPMQHYDLGKPVAGEQALKKNVVHVHQKCIEWAPRVYFENDTAQNLEKEVARAAKLKCSKCKQKGAALGCYMQSCRKTYHVLCAVELSCRWDSENFWLLCPSHVLEEFPSDRSRTEEKVRVGAASKIPLRKREADQTHDCRFSSSSSSSESEIRDKGRWKGSLNMSGKWNLCGSDLSKDDCILLAKFAEITGASVSRGWKSSVTHVIAATDELGVCSRTLEYLLAILNGKWILKVDWIKACLDAKFPVAEEKYEIVHDVHGFFGGPMAGRMRATKKAPPLFNGLSFYFSGRFDPSFRGLLEELVLAAGGTVLKEIGLPSFGLKSMIPSTFVAYNLDLSAAVADQDNIIEEAKSLADKSGFPIVPHIWILDSIAACEIQNF